MVTTIFDGFFININHKAHKYEKMKKSRGLGDTIEKVTKKTGIKTMTDIISKGLNVPCGCEGRRDALNKIFPYKK